MLKWSHECAFLEFGRKKIKSSFRDDRCEIELRRNGIHGLRDLSGIPLTPSQVSHGDCTHCAGFPGKPPHLGWQHAPTTWWLTVMETCSQRYGVQNSKASDSRAPLSPSSSWLKSSLISSGFQLACGSMRLWAVATEVQTIFTCSSSLCLHLFILL